MVAKHNKGCKRVHRHCGHCLMNQPAKTSAPPQLPDKGNRPWGCLTSDFFQIDGTTFFHITFRLTTKSIVYECKAGGTAEEVIEALKASIRHYE